MDNRKCNSQGYLTNVLIIRQWGDDSQPLIEAARDIQSRCVLIKRDYALPADLAPLAHKHITCLSTLGQIAFSEFKIQPPPTTITLPEINAISQAVFDMLPARMLDPQAKVQQQVFNCSLVIRGSIAYAGSQASSFVSSN